MHEKQGINYAWPITISFYCHAHDVILSCNVILNRNLVNSYNKYLKCSLFVPFTTKEFTFKVLLNFTQTFRHDLGCLSTYLSTKSTKTLYYLYIILIFCSNCYNKKIIKHNIYFKKQMLSSHYKLSIKYGQFIYNMRA